MPMFLLNQLFKNECPKYKYQYQYYIEQKFCFWDILNFVEILTRCLSTETRKMYTLDNEKKFNMK